MIKTEREFKICAAEKLLLVKILCVCVKINKRLFEPFCVWIWSKYCLKSYVLKLVLEAKREEL